MSGALRIGSAVGRQPALNSPRDQMVIMDLLSRITPADGGPANPLPPATPGGQADYRLCNAIFNFQLVMSSRGLLPKKYCDGRVDPNGATLSLLNRHAAGRGGGGGLLIPIDPSPPKPAPPQKGPGFLQSLFSKLTPRPTNWKIAGTATVSLSIETFGAAAGRMIVTNTQNPGSAVPLSMIGGGLSLGPAPGGIEIAPSNFPSMGSQIHAGPRTTSTTLPLQDLLGMCLLAGVSASVTGGGGNATVVLFNIGVNRSLQTLGQDALTALSGPNGFLVDAFNSCRAFGCVMGVFAGLSVGVSLIEVLLRSEVPDIRPDPMYQRR